METLGSRIAFFRNSRRWTQEHLATEAGITQSTLSEIENDMQSPRWDMIMVLAQKLEIPVASLLPQGNTNIVHNTFNDNAAPVGSGSGTSSVNHYTASEELLKAKDELLKTKDELIASLKQQLEQARAGK